MRTSRTSFIMLAAALVVAFATYSYAQSPSQSIGINVVLKTAPTNAILTDLGRYGTVRDVIPEIDGVTMMVKSSQLTTIQSLPYVAAANPDRVRKTGPEPAAAVDNYDSGLSTWDLDAINVTTGPGFSTRGVAQDGSGAYVAVLDTGLLNNWTYYFPQNRIATQYARSFGGGGGEVGNVSTQPNKWEEDQNSHGTHVTSTILGYRRTATAYMNGVAPNATVIPVKVLNQNGSGWSSVIARGITYIGDLKAGELSSSPVVINMSLGGPTGDALEKAALDYAIRQGVIIVASAGNEGTHGMGYPGAYDEVISVAAAGWVDEWIVGSWWYNRDVYDPSRASDFYIAGFSSRELAGQHLDVAAPGTWVVGPYQVNGQISYYYLGGTSMASPHVAGTAALMAQKNPTLTQAQAESILKGTALALPAGCLTVRQISGGTANECWGTNAAGSGLIQADSAIAATPAPL